MIQNHDDINDRASLRTLLDDAIANVTRTIALDGDGPLPLDKDPWKARVNMLSVRVETGRAPGTSTRVSPLPWSTVRDVLVGLKDYSVVQGRWLAVGFDVWEALGDGIPMHTGWGQLGYPM